jgi:hypothetical protein
VRKREASMSRKPHSLETREKLRETWSLSPPSRLAKWMEILSESNIKKRDEINRRTEKICSTCKSSKLLGCFAKNRTSADGHATVCFECRKEYDRKRYENKGVSIRDRVKRYRKENLPKVNAMDAAKIKKRKLSTPKWLTFIHRALIEEFYEIAAARTMQTGVEHHVDHVVPIKGKQVSGLTVPWNLQVLTAQNNLRKHASFTGE